MSDTGNGSTALRPLRNLLKKDLSFGKDPEKTIKYTAFTQYIEIIPEAS